MCKKGSRLHGEKEKANVKKSLLVVVVFLLSFLFLFLFHVTYVTHVTFESMVINTNYNCNNCKSDNHDDVVVR